ncbi:MAG: ketoacyl-ACP synthase III [Gammaproteobacteria bacterium]|jgi:3-oxoacyl-[acyl-carrier-protein] synthase III|nr:ketoacyl-ACP synthase III [Gammaproteobacteria bacterium]
MNFAYQNKVLSGLMVVLPENERLFLDDMKEFNAPTNRSLKLKNIMGYDKHRVVHEGICVSDLAIHGMNSLFDRNFLSKDEFDALIVVTQSPDYFIPPTSNVIQGELGLKSDLFCMDITQGCAGYIVGLMQAFMMLDQDNINKVVLINGDVLSRKVSKKDRNSYPLIGDGVSISILENKTSSQIFGNLKMDGTKRDALIIPAGGFRLPSNPETALLQEADSENMRALDHLKMDGTAVFNFVQQKVPEMISELINQAGSSLNEIDYFACHQPNKFMLEKLADKIGVPHSKMPNNIVEHFGNSSGVTIPTVLTHNLRDDLLKGELNICLAGFGVGLTWGSILMKVGQLDFCDMLDY